MSIMLWFLFLNCNLYTFAIKVNTENILKEPCIILVPRDYRIYK